MVMEVMVSPVSIVGGTRAAFQIPGYRRIVQGPSERTVRIPIFLDMDWCLFFSFPRERKPA